MPNEIIKQVNVGGSIYDIEPANAEQLDADLEAIATLTGTGFAYRSGEATWVLKGDISVEVTGTGDAIVSASYDATSRKITLTKGGSFLTEHQSIKTLDTTATTAQSTSASEAIAGSGKVTLHKVSKTGTASDLIGYSDLALKSELNDYVKHADVVDDLASTVTNNPLSANQGRVLNEKIASLEGRGRYLSAWNATAGAPGDLPGGGSSVTEEYVYRTGDYFIVSTAGSKFPTGTSIAVGTTIATFPSETRASETVEPNDTILYSGSGVWTAIHTPVRETAWGTITGTLSNQTDLNTALAGKATANTSTEGNGAHKHTYTPEGTIESTFTGTSATSSEAGGHSHTYTPSGSISVASSGTVNYTPAGTVSKPIFSAEQQTTDSAGEHTHTVSLTKTTDTVRDWDMTYSEGVLTINGMVSKTFTNVTAASASTVNAHSHTYTPDGTLSTPTFSGTGVRLAFSGSQGTSSTEAAHTHAVTATGTVASTFTGTAGETNTTANHTHNQR